MPLWTTPSDRRPEPEPLRTNDVRAFAVGLAGWMLGLAFVAVMLTMPGTVDTRGALLTIAIGLALGIVGVIVSRRTGHDRRGSAAAPKDADTDSSAAGPASGPTPGPASSPATQSPPS